MIREGGSEKAGIAAGASGAGAEAPGAWVSQIAADEASGAGVDAEMPEADISGGCFLIAETAGPEETRALGVLLAEGLEAGDFLALEGGLAAGKTCLVQGLAKGLGYEGPVASPTFSLLRLYEGGRLPLYHFDVYRLERPGELENIGYEEYFYGAGICAVEWSNAVAAYLPEPRIELKLERLGEKEPDKDGFAIQGLGRERLGEKDFEEKDFGEKGFGEKRRITLAVRGQDEVWRKRRADRLGRLLAEYTADGRQSRGGYPADC